jgi:hypothetical protein
VRFSCKILRIDVLLQIFSIGLLVMLFKHQVPGVPAAAQAGEVFLYLQQILSVKMSLALLNQHAALDQVCLLF